MATAFRPSNEFGPDKEHRPIDCTHPDARFIPLFDRMYWGDGIARVRAAEAPQNERTELVTPQFTCEQMVKGHAQAWAKSLVNHSNLSLMELKSIGDELLSEPDSWKLLPGAVQMAGILDAIWDEYYLTREYGWMGFQDAFRLKLYGYFKTC